MKQPQIKLKKFGARLEIPFDLEQEELGRCRRTLKKWRKLLKREKERLAAEFDALIFGDWS